MEEEEESEEKAFAFHFSHAQTDGEELGRTRRGYHRAHAGNTLEETSQDAHKQTFEHVSPRPGFVFGSVGASLVSVFINLQGDF